MAIVQSRLNSRPIVTVEQTPVNLSTHQQTLDLAGKACQGQTL